MTAMHLLGLCLTFSVGLVLWCAGGRLVRGGLAALGLVAGVGLGWHLGTINEVPIPLPLLSLAAGLVSAGALWFAWRALMGTTLALLLGAALPMLAWLALGPSTTLLAATPIPEASMVLARDDPWPMPDAADFQDGADAVAAEITDRLLDSARRLGTTLDEWSAPFRDAWPSLPLAFRSVLGLAAIAGILAGVVVGALLPRRSAALITALCGAGLCLAVVLEALHALGGDGWVPESTPVRAGAWLAVGVAGAGLQWRRDPRDRGA